MYVNEPEKGSLQSPESEESVWSLAAFWLVAFTGAALLAAVLLAPRWEQRCSLAARVRLESMYCAYLGELNDHLTRVIEALRHDPEFTAEMARFELGYEEPGETVIESPVANRSRPAPPRLELPPDSWAPFVRLFAHDTVVRNTSLVSALVFVLVSLVCFNTGGDRPTRR